MRRISYVTAVAEVNKELKGSETYPAGLVAYDASGLVLYDAQSGLSTLQYTTFSYEKTEIIAAVNLRKEVPLRFQTANAPKRVPDITLYEMIGVDAEQQKTTETVSITGEKSVIDKIEEIKLEGTVDFNLIDAQSPSTYQFKLTLPSVAGVTYDAYTNVSGMYFLAVVDQ